MLWKSNTLKSQWVFDFLLRNFRIICAPTILFLDSIFSTQFFLGTELFQNSFLQTPPAPPEPPAPPAPPASPAPTGEAQACIVIFIPDYCCFIFAELLLGPKLRVFVCSELFCALESNKILFPFYFSYLFFVGTIP